MSRARKRFQNSSFLTDLEKTFPKHGSNEAPQEKTFPNDNPRAQKGAPRSHVESGGRLRRG